MILNTPNSSMRNILTFDLEEWYQGLELPIAEWAGRESRLAVGMDFILEQLAQTGVQATFFVLGVVAQEHPGLVQRLAQAGHEIGAHGWSHTPLYRQSPSHFRSELRRTIDLLAELSGQPVNGHRAAFFSLTPQTEWAISELAEAGIRYDSSLFPVLNYRYGWPGAPRWPHRWPNSELFEVPLSTLALGRLNLPFSGGFYARFWPYALLHWAITRINRAGQPAVVYFHPWEFDAAHPRIGAPVRRLARATHYHRLGRTRSILAALLRDFEWTAMGRYYDFM